MTETQKEKLAVVLGFVVMALPIVTFAAIVWAVTR